MAVLTHAVLIADHERSAWHRPEAVLDEKPAEVSAGLDAWGKARLRFKTLDDRPLELI